MAIKVYEINGVWNTFEYWHDHEGYTTQATLPVSYKTCSANDWGAAAQDGYWGEGSLYDWPSTKFWAQGVVGWYSPNEFASLGLCPSGAEPYIMTKGAETSDAFRVTDLSETSYYLLRSLLSLGWRTDDEWAVDGWTPQPAPVCDGGEFILVNSDTGEIIHSVQQDNIVYSQPGFIMIPDVKIILVEINTEE